MEFTEAMEMVKVTNPVQLSELRMALDNPDEPQKNALVHRALSQIEEGLAHLAAHGHQFDIVPRSPGAALTFPKMLYKSNVPEMIVESQEELDRAMADGWYEHPRGWEDAAKEGQEPEDHKLQY